MSIPGSEDIYSAGVTALDAVLQRARLLEATCRSQEETINAWRPAVAAYDAVVAENAQLREQLAAMADHPDVKAAKLQEAKARAAAAEAEVAALEASIKPAKE